MKEKKSFRLPNKTPKELFGESYKIVLSAVIITILAFAFVEYGFTSKSFKVTSAISGALIFSAVTAVCLLVMRRWKFGSLTRFIVMYAAFVPHLSISYLSKLSDFDYLFRLRDDTFGFKWTAGLAYWASDLLSYVQVLIPMMILMLGALTFKKFSKWYIPVIVIATILAFMIWIFSGTVNICRYLIALLLVCVISDCWEKLRSSKSMEPEVMVHWAEVIFFGTLWLKSFVDFVEYLK
ncbi:MAG: hypothetical protein K6G57_06610 [Lachnospiraceae bacterium]|nr:hypothetical protein [Lachnospiraceae bacterium]